MRMLTQDGAFCRKARIALELAEGWPGHALSEATVGRILRWRGGGE